MRRGKRMAAIFVLPLLIFALAIVYTQQKEKARLVQATADYRACETNLQAIDAAATLYSEGNDGRSPSALTDLVPDYTKELPICPAGGVYMYERMRVAQGQPVIRAFGCTGDVHTVLGVPRGRPRFRSDFGLVDVPELNSAK